jgi:osmoprotectant transport system substrate-binding protein
VKRAIVVTLALVSLLSCSQGSESRQEEQHNANEIVIGSFNFTENQILGDIYATALEQHDYPIARLPDVATREIMEPALEQGVVDFVPEYQGTALTFLELRESPLAISAQSTYQRLQRELAGRGLIAFRYAPAESKNEVVVSSDTAAQYDLVTISDLEPVAGNMVFGGPPECPSRPLCLAGLEAIYGLEFGSFQPLDAGGPLTAAALRSGEVDAGILFTSSPDLVPGDLTLLVDDRRMQPPENIVPFARREIVETYGGDLVRLVNSISARLSTISLRTLNQRVEVGGEDPLEVARDWVEEEGLGQ